jgi:hypothetical protein
MSDQQKYEIAKEYVDRQIETMKSFDAAPAELSEDEYQSLIEDVADLVQA